MSIVFVKTLSAPQIAAEMGGRIGALSRFYLSGRRNADRPRTRAIGAHLRYGPAAVRCRSRAEITVECAPGTLDSATLESLLRCGVNRVSLGVQSFVDQEAAAVGRLHKRATVLDDIARLRGAGITNINIDLIAGLPHQTA